MMDLPPGYSKLEQVRPCGTCSLCCKLPSLGDPPDGGPIVKPVNKWCVHCKVGAAKPCTIYDTRPDECRRFICLWAAGATSIPDVRPDKAHIVVAGHQVDDLESVLIHVDPAYPGAINDVWGDTLEAWMRAGFSIRINKGDDQYIMASADTVKKRYRDKNVPMDAEETRIMDDPGIRVMFKLDRKTDQWRIHGLGQYTGNKWVVA